jgi:hypothetical protein
LPKNACSSLHTFRFAGVFAFILAQVVGFTYSGDAGLTPIALFLRRHCGKLKRVFVQ